MKEKLRDTDMVTNIYGSFRCTLCKFRRSSSWLVFLRRLRKRMPRGSVCQTHRNNCLFSGAKVSLGTKMYFSEGFESDALEYGGIGCERFSHGCRAGKKVFDKLANLKLHISKVHFKQPSTCTVCGETFHTDEKTFKRHRDKCANITYQCEHCKYSTLVQVRTSAGATCFRVTRPERKAFKLDVKGSASPAEQ